MIIRVQRDLPVQLDEPNDFRRLKIVADGDVDRPLIAASLKPYATIEADEAAAWISRAALCTLAGSIRTAQWEAALDRMIDAVRRFGWVNDELRTVRAHIECETASTANDSPIGSASAERRGN